MSRSPTQPDPCRRWPFAALMLAAGLAAAPAIGSAPDLESLHALERRDPAAVLEQVDQHLAAGAAALELRIEASLHLHRSHALLMLGRHGEALAAGEQARELAEDDGVPGNEAPVYAALAVIYEIGGLEGEALSMHRRAIELFARDRDAAREASAWLNLGNLFETRGDLDEAEAAYRRAIELKRSAGVDQGIPGALGNLGLLAVRDGRPQDAIELLQRAQAAFVGSGDRIGEAVTHRNLATALRELGRHEEALGHIDRAEAIASELGHEQGRAAAFEARAAVLSSRALQQQGEAGLLAQALEQNGKALAIAGGNESSYRLRLLEQRADLAEAAGQPALALAAMREAESLASRINRDAERRRFDLLSARYDSERQRAEIAQLRERAAAGEAEVATQRLQRNLALGAVLLVLLLGATLYGRTLRRRKDKEVLAEHNRALSTALGEADRQRRSAEDSSRVNESLLRIAAEDLRQPLTRVLGSAERLMMLAREHDDLRLEAARIADASHHLVEMVGNLAETAELGREDLVLRDQPLDLGALATEVCALFALRAQEKRQPLDCSQAQALPARGDALRLRQAIEHLVSNAIKFTPHGRAIEVRVRRDGDNAVVEVLDQGPGLRDEDRKRLFGKFQRLSARPTGNEPSTGLGLSLAQRIAELHGGHIEAGNRERGGSRFALVLPLPD